MDELSPAGSPWRALTANEKSTSPAWSPDGKRIAYWSEGHITVVDAASGVPVRLTRADRYYDLTPSPRWSPDGTRLAFASAVGQDNVEVFIVNADGSGLTNVTRNAAWDGPPSWSPDGRRLVFSSSRERIPTTRSYGVFVMDADGSNVERITSWSGYCWVPGCSPDGRQIIVSSGRGLYVMNADGSSMARLVKTPQNSWDSAPVWRR